MHTHLNTHRPTELRARARPANTTTTTAAAVVVATTTITATNASHWCTLVAFGYHRAIAAKEYRVEVVFIGVSQRPDESIFEAAIAAVEFGNCLCNLSNRMLVVLELGDDACSNHLWYQVFCLPPMGLIVCPVILLRFIVSH